MYSMLLFLILTYQVQLIFYLAGQDVGLDHRVSVFQCKRVFVVVVVMLQLILN